MKIMIIQNASFAKCRMKQQNKPHFWLTKQVSFKSLTTMSKSSIQLKTGSLTAQRHSLSYDSDGGSQ